jgi:hypothetical protein
LKWISLSKKIWCASRARVNLPHIGNCKCIQFVLQRFFFNNTQGLPFLSRYLYGTLRSLQFCPWFRKLLPKLPSDLFEGEICLTKFMILPFLDGIYMGASLRMSNFKILSIFFRFLDLNIGHKNFFWSVLGRICNQT